MKRSISWERKSGKRVYEKCANPNPLPQEDDRTLDRQTPKILYI
jgi:hypothetical protein